MERITAMKKIILACLLSALPVCIASADITEYSAVVENGVCVVSGAADEKSENVALEIIGADYSFDESAANSVNLSNYKEASVYENQTDFSGSSHKFSFTVPLGDISEKYNAKLSGKGFSVSEEFVIKNVSAADFTQTLSALKNNMGDYDAFGKFMSDGDNAFYLMCDEAPESSDRNSAERVLYNSLKSVISDINTPQDMEKLWNKCIAASMLADKKVNDISQIKNYLDMSDSAVKSWYDNAEGQSGALSKLTELLRGKTFNSAENFDTELKRALVLTTVRYPNGVKNIGLALNDFSKVTGITRSDEISKYTQIAGKDYSDFDLFLKDFNSLKDKTTTKSTGGGGGGSSSSKQNVFSVVGSGSESKAETIDMKFIDLDTVPWAYEAISALCDKGIIAGRSEDRFVPDEVITREEFVKLCVCALGLENEAYTNKFSDVQSGAWYEKYVNIAFARGICSGIGDGAFGIGESITREDMTVMLYNALKTSGYEAQQSGNTFADDELISAYAKEAVSMLTEAGVINGVGDNKFDPKANATRAQAAKVIFGALKLI